MIRLNRYLASTGIGSRRKCDEYIVGGRIKVNGEVVQKLGIRIDELSDKVEFDGHEISPVKREIYILLNKPLDIITTTSDDHQRKTVLDLIQIEERIFPVGRLDQDTTGLLLLTNDGELTNNLIHPRYKIRKTYRVLLDRKISAKDAYHFERGINLDGQMTTPCKLTEIRVIDNGSFMEVVLSEGRKRQIRRMFEILGYQVIELDRIAFGPLTLAGLKRGEWRYLTKAEVEALKKGPGEIS